MSSGNLPCWTRKKLQPSQMEAHSNATGIEIQRQADGEDATLQCSTANEAGETGAVPRAYARRNA